MLQVPARDVALILVPVNALPEVPEVARGAGAGGGDETMNTFPFFIL